MKLRSIIIHLIILIFLIIIGKVYFPVVKEFFLYNSYQNLDAKIMRQKEAKEGVSQDPDVYEQMLEERQIMIPKSEEFGIVIPKLRINKQIIPEVDFRNKNLYLAHLNEGVAHAQWSAYPGRLGTIILFSHADDSFWNSTTYNPKFFMLNRLEEEDTIVLFYRGDPYYYEVKKVEKIPASKINYLADQNKKELLTIQSTWPPGLSLWRVLVTAELIDE